MKVVVDSWAWLKKESLSELQLSKLRTALTVIPRKAPEYPGEDPGPLYLYTETPELFGVAREYFLANKRPEHEYVLNVSNGATEMWPSRLTFTGKLREEQARAIAEISQRFKHGGLLGGMIKAGCGWGKTVAACALITEMQVPTLVVVHKEFLMAQWRERLTSFLPGVRLGLVQQDECTYLGCHVVLAMVHTLASRVFPDQFIQWPGLVITDEVHRTGAATWSVVPAKFPARWRLGITATPHRKDGAEKVFQYHIGEIVFSASEQRMKPKIRRVHTTFQVLKTAGFNPALMNKSILLKFLCASQLRNRVVAMQVVMALQAGRKVLVLSERLNHLEALHKEIQTQWGSAEGPCPSIDYYVGGRKEKELGVASKAQVILATSQYACVDVEAPQVDPITGATYTLAQVAGAGSLPAVIGGTGFFSVHRPTSAGVFGTKRCLEIELVDGRKLVVSADHQMWTDHGWAAAAALKVGNKGGYAQEASYLASPRCLLIDEVPCPLTKDQAWLLGLLIGDGALSQTRNGNVQLITGDQEIVIEARRVLLLVGGDLRAVKNRPYHWRVVGVGKRGRGKKTWLRTIIERYGLATTAHHKKLPEELMRAPMLLVGALIAGFLDSDGHQSTARGEIGFTSVSHSLLEQIRTLLLRLGVPVVHPLVPDAAGCATLRLSWEESDHLLTIIAPRLLRKSRPFRRGRHEINGTNAVPPRFLAELRAAVRLNGHTLKEARSWCSDAGISCGGLRGGHRELPLVGYTLVADRLGFVGSLDKAVVWRRVVGLRDVGEKLVGDFAVPPTKAWIYDGVVVHNSEGLDIPALDTLVLSTPLSDVEQAVGRILRPFEGKKDPIVVDIRDDKVGLFRALGTKRDVIYERMT